ncbi:hypothetical protein JCM8097_005774 [Rhodosporidiobolus ruineniae]
MLVFVTGASGFVGRSVVPELLANGHEVLALARTDDTAAKLEAIDGVSVLRGSLDDLDSLKEGARKADGVIHLAFKHDFENYLANGQLDVEVTKAIADTLAGTDKPFVITSGTALFAMDSSRAPGSVADEDAEHPAAMHQMPRIASERTLRTYVDKGVRGTVVRLPPSVHGAGDGGFVPWIVHCARTHDVSPFVGSGENVWPGVDVRDAAKVFRLALEKGKAGSAFHALGDGDRTQFKEIARLVGERLKVPVKQLEVGDEAAEKHFGFLARFATLDNLVSSEKTKEALGWKPTGPTLKEELAAGTYC